MGSQSGSEASELLCIFSRCMLYCVCGAAGMEAKTTGHDQTRQDHSFVWHSWYQIQQ